MFKEIKNAEVMDTASIKVIQQQWNGIVKQRSKAMLMRILCLDRCMRIDGALMKIIQQQWNRITKQRSKAMLMRNLILERCMSSRARL